MKCAKLATCAGLLVACHAASAQLVIRPMAVAGDPYPIIPGATMIEFGVPSVSRNGRVGVSVKLAGPGITPANDTAIIRIDAPFVAFPIVREGDPAPGTGPGVVFGGGGFVFGQAPFSDIVTGMAGELSFGATLTGPGVNSSNDTGIWYYDINIGNVAMLLREGGSIALSPYSIGSVLVNRPICPGPPESPQVVTLTGPGITSVNNTAIVLGFPVPAGPRILIQENDPIAPAVGSPVFGDFGFGSVTSHSLGPFVSVNTILRGFGVGPGNDNAVFAGNYVAGQIPPIPMIAREGDPAPLPIRTVNHGGIFTPPSTADPEHAVFLGRLTGTPIGAHNDEVVWWALTQSGVLTPMIWKGSPVTNRPGLTHAGSFGNPVVAPGGRTVVSGDIAGPLIIPGFNDRALFEGAVAHANLIAQRGDTLNGLAPGEAIFGLFDAPCTTLAGWTAVFTKLTGASIIPGVNDEAIFVHLTGSEPTLAMRNGASITTPIPGVGGIVAQFAFADGHGRGSGGTDGRPSMISDGGTVVVRIEFTNGTSGIFRTVGCYANCDNSWDYPELNVFDFLCFGNKFAQGDSYACDCDTSTGLNVCDIFDFLCFSNQFAHGCP